MGEIGDLEQQIQKQMEAVCKLLPAHVEKWTSVLQESSNHIQNLKNLSEQLCCVLKVQFQCMDNIDDMKSALEFQIITRAEEEITILKRLIDDMGKANHDLRMKLFSLEKCTVNLDWDNNGSLLIVGSGSQPPLSKFLQYALEFFMFFSRNHKLVSENFKKINLRDLKSITEIEESFNIDLNSKCITYLLALTQYVQNEKSIS